MSTEDKTMSDELVIDVRNVSKCYHLYDRPQDRLLQSIFRGRRKFYRDFWALTDVSLQVRRGESVGIIGRNGSGKSTLLQIIAGTLTPTSGDVIIQGRISALLQLGSGFNPEFSGRENIYLNGAILGFSRAQLDKLIDEVVYFADIGEFVDQPIKTYSSGMAMRLAFSVSVCLEPEILIVDEALAVGDAAFQFRCIDRLKQLQTRGVTLLFVSHDIGLVKSLCSKLVYLSESKVVAQGDPAVVAEAYLHACRQAELLYSGAAITLRNKAKINPKSPLCFGSDEGEIVDAKFIKTSALSEIFSGFEEIKFSLTVSLSSSVEEAWLCVILDTVYMTPIGGVRVELPATGNGEKIICSLSIPSEKLVSGNYFITAILQGRLGVNQYRPIDKQPGILSFRIDRSKEDLFLPCVDLGASYEIEVHSDGH